jgi:hypothetical protein
MTSATLNGELASLGTAGSATVSFVWGTTSGGPYNHETALEARGIGAFSADLTGLTPGTTYYCRAKADGDGDPVYGEEKAFTTPTTAPSVTTNDVTNVATTSATLNGELSSLGIASSINVSFEWGAAAGSYAHTTADQARTSTGAFSADLTGLTPGTTYYCRAKADGDGDAVYGEEQPFTTPTTAPSVTTNDATNFATTSATLNGELASLGTASSVNVSFEWGTATGSYTHTTADQARIGTGAFSADLSGLTPGTTYYYRAKADGDGDAVYGEEKSFTTLTAPPKATTSSATEVHSTSATLNGIIDSLGTAGSVEVSFEWGLTTAYGSETTPWSETTTGDFNATLTDLIPNTAYHFRAKAIGHGIAYGDDIVFTTPPAQKTWYLSDNSSGTLNVMYDGDTSKPAGTVRIFGASGWQVWRADLPSEDTTYPAGTWTVWLTLSHINSSHEVDVEIGTFNGDAFTPYGSHTFVGSAAGVYSAGVSASSITVPSGSYVATRIRVNDDHILKISVGDSQSYVRSPLYSESSAHSLATDTAGDDECPSATVSSWSCMVGTVGIDMGRFDWRLAIDPRQWDRIAAEDSGSQLERRFDQPCPA